MKIALVAVLLLSSLEPAGALQKAHPRDFADIQTQIELANSAQTNSDNAFAKADRIYYEAEEDPRIKKEYDELQEEANRLLNVSIEARRQAIWLTIRAYDILPFMDDKPLMDEGISVVPSPEKGKKIIWLPIQGLHGEYQLQDASGRRLAKTKSTLGILGNTASDGVSRILPEAFTSPGELALVLSHERRHFKQNITPGQGDKKTVAELEVEAYEEELKLLDAFELSEGIKKFQKGRINKILNGDDRSPGKRAIAKRERAAADKLRGGMPLANNSVVSLSEEDLQYLVREAHEQVKIAQVAHDARLRNTILQLTRRSCSNPGSVSQAELNYLPKPHNYEFAYDRHPSIPGAQLTPQGVGRCRELYDYLCRRAGHRDGDGPNAETVKQLSIPTPSPQLAELKPTFPSLPVFPADIQAQVPFRAALPRLREFAASSCRAPIAIFIDTTLTNPAPPHAFSVDDQADANGLEAGLDTCSLKLFRRLIVVLRNRGGHLISAEWVREEVARFTPVHSPTKRRGSGDGDGGGDGGGDGPPTDPDHGKVRDRVGRLIPLKK